MAKAENLGEGGSIGGEGAGFGLAGMAELTAAEKLKAVLATPDGLSLVLGALLEKSPAVRDAPLQSTSTISPWQRHVAKAEELLKAHKFVDPVTLDSVTEEHMRFKSVPTRVVGETEGGLMIVGKEVKAPDVSRVFDPARTRNGYLRMVTLASKCAVKSVSSRVHDFLALDTKVWNYPNASDLSKSTFLKHFLLEHEASDDLVGEFDKATTLLARFMWSIAQPQSQSSGYVAPKRKLPKLGPGSLTSASTADKRARFMSEKPCYSRVEKGKVCDYPGCKFNHACVSCGQDHTASECNAFDEQKSKAALADMKRRPRRNH